MQQDEQARGMAGVGVAEAGREVTHRAGAPVTAAMAGLHRWSSVPGAPEEVRRRRDDALVRLRATTEVLGTAVRWTDAGADYFANLLARRGEPAEACDATG